MSVLSRTEMTLVDSVPEQEAFLRWLGERRPILALDIETSGLSLANDVIRLVQFGDARHGWALPYDDWRGIIRHVLGTYEGPLVLQHAKFDAGFLQRDGLPFPWPRVHDTMIMNFLVDSQGPKSLKAAAAKYIDPIARAGESELKAAMRKGRWNYGTIPVDLPVYWGYACVDTILTALLAERQWPLVQPYREAYDLEMACQRVLCDMEMRGIRVDLKHVHHQLELAQIQLEQHQIALGDLNPSANADVVTALESAGFRLKKRTDAGNKSVDDSVLSGIDHPIARNVLGARFQKKMIGSYLENFIGYAKGDRLHPHINQLQARTGRMSVTEPALQTLPRKKFIRDAFLPDEGDKMVLVDYDTQELRVAAGISGDEALSKRLIAGEDVHLATAVMLYGKEKAAAGRSVAKNSMYSKLYGAFYETFSETAGVSLAEARAVYDALEKTYPGLTKMMDDITTAVISRKDEHGMGYVVLGDGRRLRLPVYKAYAGTNYRIQGECSNVLKRGLVDLDAAGYGTFLRLPVHDEDVFSIPEDEVSIHVPEICRIMTRDDYPVPLTVGAKVVDRWGDPYE